MGIKLSADAQSAKRRIQYLRDRTRNYLGIYYSQHGIADPTLSDAVLDYPFREGSKGIRPALCLNACDLYDGNFDAALPVAGALELLHNYFLILDDIQDRSTKRRGEPTLHTRYGLETALNASTILFKDALLCMCFEYLGRDYKPEKILKIYQLMSDMIGRTMEGQQMEQSWVRQNRWDITPEDYFKMAGKKTGYTVGDSCKLGVACSGIGESDVDHELERFDEAGRILSVVFQMRDDLLDLMDVPGMRKTRCLDIYEGKRTLPMIHLMQKLESSPEDRRYIVDLYRNGKQPNPSQVRKVKRMLEDSGAIDFTQERICSMATAAHDVIEHNFRDFPYSSAKLVIKSLPELLTQRLK